jgi:hypothetical protein
MGNYIRWNSSKCKQNRICGKNMILSKAFQYGIIIGFISGELARYSGTTGNYTLLFSSVILLYFIMTRWFPLFKNESNMEELDDE